ncbi:unnamed protein product [Rotaria magnacalcarata]|uniref:SET domain-containing protein n=4 Tax=Rotaria magnacalcarata TaxID=392030 RepID=A0A816XH54_9BILA|nr:unnamed protein product [Rotaria magnacalcarata]CAF2231373.1 unnamed protein product [Rotaria magnacalcarata]CAF4120045.1 unnamed protein product [Rotaria magnacalcarata]CAF4196410.1 unnamed protein product [Rotaria magnacalcarata]
MSVNSDYLSFHNWIKTNGGQIHENVKIDVKEERGLFATDTIESYAALVTVPRSLIVNNQHSDLSTVHTDTERQGLMMFLIREYTKGDASFWFPWIKLLNVDKEADELLKIKMHLFDCVEHSTLGQALTARYQQLQEEYEQLNFTETNFELFCAVDHLVWSRVLDLPESEPLSLVPFIDFANHSLNANARWFLDDETRNLILRSEQILKSGEEITINYGLKSNEELLYLYGFTLSDNPNDRVTLPVSLLPDDVLLADKLRLIQELNLPPRLTLNCNGHLNEQSNRLVKILSAQTHTSIDIENEYYKPYLLNLFSEYLNELNACSDDEKFIKYYLDSQKCIVQKAIDNLK